MTATPASRSAAKSTQSPAEPPRKPIHGSKSRLAQFIRNSHVVYVPDDMSLEALEDPATWIHAGRDFAVHDRIEAVSATRWTELLVYDIGPGHYALKVLTSIELPPRSEARATALPPGYAIRLATPGERELGKYSVVRLNDETVMNRSQRHDSYEEARRWLLDLAIFRT